MNVFLEGVTAYCGICCSISFQSQETCRTEKKTERSHGSLPSVHYKAKRVGELSRSTDSALPPPPL